MIPASDDPAMFPTTLPSEYRIMHGDLGLSHERLRAMALAWAEASAQA